MRRTTLTMLTLAILVVLSTTPTAPVGVMASPALRARKYLSGLNLIRRTSLSDSLPD
jgi:hypothetical protein